MFKFFLQDIWVVMTTLSTGCTKTKNRFLRFLLHVIMVVMTILAWISYAIWVVIRFIFRDILWALIDTIINIDWSEACDDICDFASDISEDIGGDD